MPIQFPSPSVGNPFDRWQWVRGARCPQQQPAPNLARVGAAFTAATLNPGIGHGVRIPVNLRNLGRFYQDGPNSGAVVPPAATLRAASAVPDGVIARRYMRATGQLRMVLSGVSRDSAGAALGLCQVLVFRTEDKSLVAETTSDASGNWSLSILKGGPFFLVEYKAGSPDVAGTSVNTLVPSRG